MTRFGLTDKQAQAILDMRLQRLTGLERDKIIAEYEKLLERITYLKKILETPQMVLDIIKEEMTEIKEKYANPRRTEITYTADDNIDMDELIQEEEMVVTLTHFGYVKRIRSDAYRTQRRGGKGITGLSAREEDCEHVIVTSTHSTLMFFTNRGKVAAPLLTRPRRAVLRRAWPS